MAVNVTSREVDPIISALAERCAVIERVGSLDELRVLLHARSPGAPTTLDLLGHSATSARLLVVGRDLIDMCDPAIERAFQTLAREQVFARQRITGLRLLGCQTAATPAGRHTMRRLEITLGVPVHGTTKVILPSHYDAGGFNPAFDPLLVRAAPTLASRDMRAAVSR